MLACSLPLRALSGQQEPACPPPPPKPPLQVDFKRALLQDVRAFVVDAVAFRQDWEASGPTVPGLSPMDAADRLRKYQQLFEVRRRKWDSYAAGEELFGLPVTQYPELERTQEEIAMLDRLYRWAGWAGAGGGQGLDSGGRGRRAGPG